MSFFSKLEARSKAINSLLCVGLDPHDQDIADLDENKGEAVVKFCEKIVSATLPYAACYKPNAAFFEKIDGGMEILKRVIKSITDRDVLVLLDVKRGDIGSTATAYAKGCYDHLGADAVTLSPLMGWDSVEPFVTGPYDNKGAFLLCKTSNPGSNELLALTLTSGESLFERIAHLVGSEWSNKLQGESSRLGLVVGATDADALSRSRQSAGQKVWILAPGVGAQGGDLNAALQAGLNEEGSGLIIPVSRGISRAEDPAAAAKEYMGNINSVREKIIASSAATATGTTDDVSLYQRRFIEFSLSQGVLKFGSFVLKSGRTSPYFFNAGLFASGQALCKLGKAYASAIMNSKELVSGNKPNFDVIFGPAYKGISLGAVVSSALYSDFGIDVGFAYDRKEAKDHGEGGKLVGASMEGKKTLIVDDVITAGTAIRESHAMLTKIGAKIIGVSIALDRAEKRSLDDPVSAVQAVSRDLQIPVVSIVNLPQLQQFLMKKESVYGEEVLKSVSDYRTQYGV